jgi:hypothetical protein
MGPNGLAFGSRVSDQLGLAARISFESLDRGYCQRRLPESIPSSESRRPKPVSTLELKMKVARWVLESRHSKTIPSKGKFITITIVLFVSSRSSAPSRARTSDGINLSQVAAPFAHLHALSPNSLRLESVATDAPIYAEYLLHSLQSSNEIHVHAQDVCRPDTDSNFDQQEGSRPTAHTTRIVMISPERLSNWPSGMLLPLAHLFRDFNWPSHAPLVLVLHESLCCGPVREVWEDSRFAGCKLSRSVRLSPSEKMRCCVIFK